jgi:predicted nucleic acid-binding protein
MSADSVFVDTNVIVYAYSKDDSAKRQIARNAIVQEECIISTQVLNEFSSTSIHKFNQSAASVQTDVNDILSKCSLLYVDAETIAAALDLQGKYGYRYYDSLMLASALDAGCRFIYTEDMADGQLIESTLRIKNIFKTVL